jgi:hypothetical protein
MIARSFCHCINVYISLSGLDNYVDILTPVVYVPCERCQLLTQDHLGTEISAARLGKIPSVVDYIVRSLIDLTDEMAYTHMCHDKNERDPWHHRSFDAKSNDICSNGAGQKNPQPIP